MTPKVQKKLKKMLYIAAFCLAGPLFAPTTLHARDLDRIISDGVLNVGVNLALPPLGAYGPTNTPEGFDIDMADRIAHLMGVKANFIPITSGNRIPYLLANKIDIVLGGMTRTVDRALVIDFTAPLYAEGFGILSVKGHDYKDFADLNSESVRLVGVRGSSALPFVQANMPKAQLLLLDSYADAIMVLAQNRADALVDVMEYMAPYTRTHPAVAWQTANPADVALGYDCIGLARGNDSLRRWLNLAIFTLHDTHVIEGTYRKWFGLDDPHPIRMSPAF
ncbi:transporter substrate-binding domain-containing protein [Komagataeibacter sp. AV436]|uniref:Transporter substrate-binding domain-containing protein n=1 Tax=Komagataeibacter melomenusus TaxID=2766578 RepID=A0ABX2ABK1_9PROT|nr:transporter substrate-binding domain-containing protein [Komagataeibacter melomenusus]MBV1829170.1 transporter substrate-binding domain-containing protein [Komagataeibacter melomenusus]NPC65491.1 transporter substrate-binding domain-containing protein [Komagataeibacter melomenusus]